MDSNESGNPPPPEFAVDQLVKQLNREHLDTAPSAIDALQKAALNSDNLEVRLKAIKALGDFTSMPTTEAGYSAIMEFRSIQAKARDKIAAIAFGSDQKEVRLAAIWGLSKSLNVPVLEDEGHQNTIQLIAIIGSTTPDNNVKNEAIAVLSGYSARKNSGGGYHGSVTHSESQNYANAAVGVVSKPAPAPAPL